MDQTEFIKAQKDATRKISETMNNSIPNEAKLNDGRMMTLNMGFTNNIGHQCYTENKRGKARERRSFPKPKAKPAWSNEPSACN